jgi:3-oxosteroid 1-dehydrogenase
MTSWDTSVDFLVVGSGAAGMTAALHAHDLGGETVIIEKAAVFGGSTAVSGGVVWVPNNPLMARQGISDSPEAALRYLEIVTSGSSLRERLQAYIETAPRMMTTMAETSHVRFECLAKYPDYYPEVEGGMRGGRSCEPAVFDALRLGAEFWRLRFPPREKLVLGGRAMIKAADASRLLTGGMPAAWFMLHRLFVYYTNVRARRQGSRVTDLTLGSALAGRLRLSLMDRGVPLWLDTPMKEILSECGCVVGAVAEKAGKPLRIQVRKGVLLAAGGFERNAAMRRRYQHAPTGTDWTAGCDANTGDVIELGAALGGSLDLMDEAWWCPCVVAPFPVMDRPWIVIFEKNMPGCIVVDRRGQRFMNEAAPYNEVVKRMYAANTPEAPAIPAFLIFDHSYRRRYACGPMMPSYVTPDRFLRQELKAQFFKKDDTLEGLARQIGVDAAGLTETVRRFNQFAAAGKDADFGRGDSLQDRFYAGEAGEGTNPNLGPLERPPFYAVPLFPGDLGTKGGLRTDASGRVLTDSDRPIPGLYAAGNCSASVMGRSYPGAGATIGPAMTFGFIAAEHALRGMPAPTG